jgi:hypothetical protein
VIERMNDNPPEVAETIPLRARPPSPHSLRENVADDLGNGPPEAQAGTPRRSFNHDFPQPTRVHVENEASNRYILGDPRM